jgi:predicted phage terminase large subunit-like protein
VSATIGILSFNRPTAKSFLRQIKRELETNDLLQNLFADVLYRKPAIESPKWSEDEGLVVKRKSNPKEATVEASGLVDGMPTGKHFTILNFDDVVTRESVQTPEMIKKTTAAWELADNLGTDGGVKRYIGTRYALFDTYSEMIRRGIPTRIHPCTSDGSENWSKSVLKKPEVLARKRREQGVYTFGAQMLLNPIADTAQGFKREWLQYWPGNVLTGLNMYILVDPSSGKKKNDSDYTSMLVVGAGGDKNFYIVDGVYDRLNLSERQKQLFRLHRQYRPLAVAYEEYGAQADVEHMEYVMREQNYRFSITRVGGTLAKADRIRRLVPKFEAGRFFLPQNGIVYKTIEGIVIDLARVFVEDEYVPFPAGRHDDMFDSLARIEDIGVTWPEPLGEGEGNQKPKWLIESEAESQLSGGGWMTA